MGKITIEKFQCDRCKAVFDEKPKRIHGSWGGSPTYYSVTASEDYGVAGGVKISWKEMCHPCHEQVGKELDAMVKSAASARTTSQETDHAE